MSHAPSVRRLARHEWREYRDLRLRALADSPDAFPTTLAQAQARDDTDWSRQVASGAESSSEHALVAESDSQLVGLAWSGIDGSDKDRAWLTQMWVDPGFRGFGTGGPLLGAAIRWATGVNAHFMVLSVTCGDTPASRLYARAGFEPVGQPEPLRPGSHLLAQPMRLDLRAA
ncbi:MAG: GNAT family N-acetyltransferase [Myxococcota bacterium]